MITITQIKCELTDLPEVKKILGICEEAKTETKVIHVGLRKFTPDQYAAVKQLLLEGHDPRYIRGQVPGFSAKQMSNLIARIKAEIKREAARGSQKRSEVKKDISTQPFVEKAAMKVTKDLDRPYIDRSDATPRILKEPSLKLKEPSHVDREILKMVDAGSRYVAIADRVNRELGGCRTADDVAAIVKRYRG
jgi:hypothetical protein